MSFNVSGYRLKDPDPFTFMKALAPLRPKVAKMISDQTALVLAQTITHLVDDPMGNGDPPPSSPYWDAHRELKKDQAEVASGKGESNPRIDMEFKVALYPFEGQTYARVFCEHREWIKKLESMRLMTKFDYWNSSDAPKSMSRAVWEDRYRIWESLIGRVDFVECLIVNLEPPDYKVHPSHKEIKALIVSYEERLKRVANNRVAHRHMMMDAERSEKDFQAFFRAHDWLKTDTGKVEVALEIAHQRSLLLPEITF